MSSDQLTPDVLAQPAKRAARIVATARLATARAAYERFDAGEPDALHQLRVSLRRLRSWLRAYRPELDDTTRRKTLRRLRKLVRATNDARDAEVWTAWIEAQSDTPPRTRAGHRHVAAQLTDRRDRAIRDVADRLRDDLPRVLDALTDELAGYWRHVSIDQDFVEETMALTTAELLRAHVRKLRRRMERIDAVKDLDEIHAARIAAKALRYLLNALADFAAASEIASQLSELQDTLGLVHDLSPLVDRMLEEIAAIAAEDSRRRTAKALGMAEGDDTDEEAHEDVPAPARVKPGLVDLATRARHQADDAFGQLRRTWTDKRLDAVSATVDELADSLQPTS
jgi:CHAD domain-containing protein